MGMGMAIDSGRGEERLNNDCCETIQTNTCPSIYLGEPGKTKVVGHPLLLVYDMYKSEEEGAIPRMDVAALSKVLHQIKVCEMYIQ